MSHFLRLPTFLGLALLTGLLALLASVPAIALAGHVGPIGSLHIEIATHPTPPTAEAFDFESTSYVGVADPSADIRLGTDPFIGYRQLLGLNGGVLANLGLVDFKVVGCEDAESGTFSTEVDTPLEGNVPTPNTVFLVKTGAGMLAKLNLIEIDFTAPNGLAFDYEILDCSVEPTPTPTPPPEATPTPTPTAPAATATATPTPTALAASGSTPSDGGSSALPWLAAIAGAIALIGSGSAWFAYRRRRVR